jgi:uncharacterized protein YbjQ (UPF0145 family)
MSEAPFASTLSTGGFLSLARGGFRPLQQVQGTAVVSLGYQRMPRGRGISRSLEAQVVPGAAWGGGSNIYMPRGGATVQEFLNTGTWSELAERTKAYNDARTLALSRLRDSASKAGALAVVDVRVHRGRFGHARRAVEFTALGTAVTSDRFEADEQDPVPLVGLSGTDFWKLVDSGVWPLGLVGGTSVVFILSGYRTRRARFRLSRRSFPTQEYQDYTNGLNSARFHASSRMREEATELGASGVLGISVGLTPREQRDDNLMVTVEMLGTAVAPLERGAPRPVAYALGLGKS